MLPVRREISAGKVRLRDATRTSTGWRLKERDGDSGERAGEAQSRRFGEADHGNRGRGGARLDHRSVVDVAFVIRPGNGATMRVYSLQHPGSVLGGARGFYLARGDIDGGAGGSDLSVGSGTAGQSGVDVLLRDQAAFGFGGGYSRSWERAQAKGSPRRASIRRDLSRVPLPRGFDSRRHGQGRRPFQGSRGSPEVGLRGPGHPPRAEIFRR